MDLSLILNRLSVLESRVAALENPEPQRDGDQESTPSADATKPKAVAEAVNPFLQRHPRATQKQPDPLELKPKPPPVAPQTPQQPALAIQPAPPLIVSSMPSAISPVTEAVQREIQHWSVDVSPVAGSQPPLDQAIAPSGSSPSLPAAKPLATTKSQSAAPSPQPVVRQEGFASEPITAPLPPDDWTPPSPDDQWEGSASKGPVLIDARKAMSARIQTPLEPVGFSADGTSQPPSMPSPQPARPATRSIAMPDVRQQPAPAMQPEPLQIVNQTPLSEWPDLQSDQPLRREDVELGPARIPNQRQPLQTEPPRIVNQTSLGEHVQPQVAAGRAAEVNEQIQRLRENLNKNPDPVQSEPSQRAGTRTKRPEAGTEQEVGGFDFAVEKAIQRERERNPELKGDWLGNVTKELSREIEATGQSGLAPRDMRFPRKRKEAQQRQKQIASAQDSAQQLLEQPTAAADPPLIVNPAPTNQEPLSVSEQIQRLRENLNSGPDPAQVGIEQAPRQINEANQPWPPKPVQRQDASGMRPVPTHGPAGQKPAGKVERDAPAATSPPSVQEQIQRMRDGLNDRPDPAAQPDRDPHLVDVPGQDAPQYVFDDDTPDRDLGVAQQAVNREARDATMAERQRRVQENAVERQIERQNRIQQGRDGLSADERTPEEKFNEALEIARRRSSLQGEARQRFDRQQQRQQQASGFDPWQAFEGTNQFVQPRAHEAIQTRPGRETDGLPHETFGKTVVDATKASTRAMERLSGELGEALARIEQIERDIEMRGHA